MNEIKDTLFSKNLNVNVVRGGVETYFLKLI